jgi:hypothetical protein
METSEETRRPVISLAFRLAAGTAIAVVGVFALRVGWKTAIAWAKGIKPDYTAVTKDTVLRSAASGGFLGTAAYEFSRKPRVREQPATTAQDVHTPQDRSFSEGLKEGRTVNDMAAFEPTKCR